jgi:hypothetical protein
MRNIYTAGIEVVNVLVEMHDSSILVEGADVPPAWSDKLQPSGPDWRMTEREDLEKDKEDQDKTIADLEAQLAAVSTNKADLEKRLLVREIKVKKLRREASEVPKLKEELSTLQEDHSRLPLFERLSSRRLEHGEADDARSTLHHLVLHL